MAILALSALLVFGTTTVIFRNLGAEDGALRFGFEQIIHARIPWLLLGVLWGGLALGVGALVRRRSALRFVVVALELVPVAAISWYVLSLSILPPHELAIEIGDPFPAYALADHDGVMRRVEPTQAGGPALYIFYRGDW